LYFLQADKLRCEVESLRQKLLAASGEIANLHSALDESRGSSERLHHESELVVQNVNQWVREQK
jgi:hypothetical protein